MYAILKTGGKQYRVTAGQTLKVEKLAGNAGDKLSFDTMATGKDGGFALGGKIEAEIVSAARGPKIIIFKKKRRHNYRRKNGHRQDLTIIKINTITA